MNVLSLFDGISCGRVALERAGIPVTNYFASEIDKNAIKVAIKNYPDTIQIGSVTDIKASDLPKIDLLIGGSPCQGFSFAGKQLNFEDPRSKLFFEFVRLKNELQPEKFMLENVRMKKDYLDTISQYMGVEPQNINSKFFSAQMRNRYYWTDIKISDFKDLGILFGDVRQKDGLDKYKVNRTKSREIMWGEGLNGKCPSLKDNDKARCLTTKQDRWGNAGLVEFEDFCRYLTPLECERLQTLPDDYTACISDTNRYHALGNCWTVDVIAHIFEGLKK